MQRWIRAVDRLEGEGAPPEKIDHGERSLRAAIDRLTGREQVAIPEVGVGGDQAGVLSAARPSAADTLTAETIRDLSWDEVAELFGRYGDDPEAMEKLELLVEEREAAEADADPWDAGEPSHGEGDWITNPTLRPERRLTPHEKAREEYDYYVYSQYAKCESELSFMLNREGQAKGIDTLSLFTGPVSRVKKYGSEELQAWFAINGRHTLGSFRYSMFGWASDEAAARRVRLEGFENVAHVL